MAQKVWQARQPDKNQKEVQEQKGVFDVT